MHPEQRRRLTRSVGCLGVAVVLLVVLAVGGYRLLAGRGGGAPGAVPQRCVALASDLAVTLTLDQAHYTAIVTGISVQRGLVPRAASIAMATVYQESDIRNLDHGDRDSVGLFQQRPSQGWGSVAEIMDPYYSTGRFYDALVQVPGWDSGDINDVAQEVQRSGFPEAYRDHEADGRVLASVFTGQSPAALRCVNGELGSADPGALATSLTDTLGELDLQTTEATEGTDGEEPTGAVLRVAAGDGLAWAVAAHALANAGRYGVASVTVDGMGWAHQEDRLAEWQPTGEPGDGVSIGFVGG